MIFYKKINDKSLRVIFFLLIISLLLDLYGLYSLFTNVANSISFNIYTLIETALLYLYFFHILKNPLIKKTLPVFFAFFLVFWVYQFIKNGQKEFLYNCVVLEDISILFFAITYYYDLIIKANSAYVYNEPRFWVVSAYLVYIAGTFFLLLYIPSLSSTEQLRYYLLNYIFVIIRTILLSIAMFMKNNVSPKKKFTLT